MYIFHQSVDLHELVRLVLADFIAWEDRSEGDNVRDRFRVGAAADGFRYRRKSGLVCVYMQKSLDQLAVFRKIETCFVGFIYLQESCIQECRVADRSTVIVGEGYRLAIVDADQETCLIALDRSEVECEFSTRFIGKSDPEGGPVAFQPDMIGEKVNKTE